MSAAIAFTEEGNEVLSRCNCELESLQLEIVAEGQMKTCPSISKLHTSIKNALANSGTDIQGVYQLVIQEEKRRRNIQRIKHPLRTIKNIIKKLCQ